MLDKTGVAVFTSDPSLANGESSAGIRVEDITVDIGSSSILTDVCVQAPQGSSLSILGPSGCGKTTLLRVLAGLQKTKSGIITLDGRCVVSDQVNVPPEQRNVGLVFQDWALFPHLTVLENIVFGLKRADRKAPTRKSWNFLKW